MDGLPAAVGAGSGLASAGPSNAWIHQFLSNGDPTPVPREVFERWMASGRTNAEDFLAARQAGGGREFLLKALERFPNDPRVLLAAVGLDDGPDAQRERLDRFKNAAPDNALADYLSARDHFQAGRSEQAVADLIAASGKGQFADYLVDAIQNTEELLLQAGKSPTEAKALAASSALLPQMAQLKGLAQNIAATERQYIAAGDHAAAENLARLGMQLSEHLTAGEGSRTVIGQLVGMAIERLVISPLDAQRPYDFLNGSIPDHLEQLNARRAAVKEDAKLMEQWMQSATESEVMSYFDRFKIYGEREALRWLRRRMPAG